MIKLTLEQQAIIKQIQELYEKLKATNPNHYTLQQWYGLEAAEKIK